MRCPRCGAIYNSKYDICYNCYLELKEQYTQEAVAQHEKYKNVDPQQWSSCYRLAYEETIRYNEFIEFSVDMVLPYFIKKYVYYQILEYVKPIKERQRELLKQYLKKIHNIPDNNQ